MLLNYLPWGQELHIELSGFMSRAAFARLRCNFFLIHSHLSISLNCDEDIAHEGQSECRDVLLHLCIVSFYFKLVRDRRSNHI